MIKYIIHLVIFIIFTIVPFILLLVGFRNKRDKNVALKPLAIMVLIINLLYTVGLILRNDIIFFTLSYMAIDWISLTLLRFILKYNKVYINKHIKKIIYSVIIIDNIILLVGLVLNLGFQNDSILSFIRSSAGENVDIFTVKITPYFMVHMFIAYVLLGFCIGYSIYKAIIEPKIYKARSAVILIILLFIIAINLVFLYTLEVYDYSIILYSVSLVLLYYFITYKIDRLIIGNITKQVVANMSDQLFVYNAEGEELYCNCKSNIFKDDASLSLIDLENKYLKNNKNSFTIKLSDSNEEYIFKVEKKNIKDSKDRLEGTYVLFHDVTFSTKAKEKQSYIDKYDTLTDIYNLNYFIKSASEDDNFNYTNLCIVNFKRFKFINQIFGSKTADLILKYFASELKTICEEENLRYARAKDDKFVVLLTDNYSVTIDKIRAILPSIQNKMVLTNTFSINFSISRIDNTISEAYENALVSLGYIDDSSEIIYYSKEILDKINREKILIKDFDSAIKNKELKLYFQPQINTIDNSVFGCEALSRWIHPSLGMVSPVEFIPLLEKYGLIHILDKYVWNESCKFLGELKGTKYEGLCISVNISPIDFYVVNIFEELKKLVEKYSIPTSSLKVEITESAFIADKEKIIEEISKLRKYGFLVEMDDFGSAYSSLNTLKYMPVDILKLDMKFISGEVNTKTIEILNFVVNMSHNIGFPVIAEGVESLNQLQILSNMKCKLIQGYYFSKPIPKDKLLEFLDDYKISSILNNIDLGSTISYANLKQKYDNSKYPIIVLEPVYYNNKIIDAYFFYSNAKKIDYICEDTSIYIGRTLSQITENNKEYNISDMSILLKKKNYMLPLENNQLYNVSSTLKENYILLEFHLEEK